MEKSNSDEQNYRVNKNVGGSFLCKGGLNEKVPVPRCI